MTDLDDVLPPLDRLLALGSNDTGKSRHATDFQPPCWGALEQDGVDLTTGRAEHPSPTLPSRFARRDLWSTSPKVPHASAWMAAEGVDRAVDLDVLSVLQLIALRHDNPSTYGRAVQSEALVERWRPTLAQAAS